MRLSLILLVLSLLGLLSLSSICLGQSDTTWMQLPFDVELKILLELSKAAETNLIDALEHSVDEPKKVDPEVEDSLRLQRALLRRIEDVIKRIEETAEKTGGSSSSSGGGSDGDQKRSEDNRDNQLRERDEEEVEKEREQRLQSLMEARLRRDAEERKKQLLEEARRNEFKIRVGKEWGNLPMKYYESILQESFNSEWPIEYQDLVEKFLHRLMEE